MIFYETGQFFPPKIQYCHALFRISSGKYGITTYLTGFPHLRPPSAVNDSTAPPEPMRRPGGRGGKQSGESVAVRPMPHGALRRHIEEAGIRPT